MNIRPEKSNATYNRKFSEILRLPLHTFVKNNIFALECVRPVPKADVPSLCCCGLEIEKHSKMPDQSGKKWNAKEDLKSVQTNAYGEMKLSGFRVLAGVHLKYIRASPSNTLCPNLYVLMTQYWDFEKPELIISINGGAKKMIPLNSEQKSAFKRGLINVAKTASTWIITGGFNFGVSKLVGEAAKDYNIASQEKAFIVLGIGSWGAVYNRENLVLQSNENYGDHRVTYNNAEGQFNLKGQAPLDPNHDAFILYDSGITGAFGKEIQFRTEFEMFISKRAKCSVVQVIVEGGKKCIETADEALRQGIPVVVMKGSKRAADLICDVIESNDEMMSDIIDSGLANYKVEWTITTEAEMEKLKENLKSLHDFKKKNLIKIFSMSDFTKNLDRAILEAAFSGEIDGKSLTHDEKLKLAMTFNRPDVAEESILESSLSRTEFSDYGMFIKIALMKNQWKFVNLFLSRGTQVESFLTKRLLEDLYFGKEANKYVNSNILNVFGFLKDTARSSKQNQISTVGLIVKKLTKNLVTNLYPERKRPGQCCSSTSVDNDDDTEQDIIKDFEKYKEPVTVKEKIRTEPSSCCFCCNEFEENQYIYTGFPPKNKSGQRIYSEQDLFIWALLTQRWEMAKIFWENGKDHIGSALIGSVICNSLGKIANKEGEVDMAATLQTNAQDFEDFAINILSQTYWRDKTRTHLLLIRSLPFWGRITCMQIANKCQIINFLSHSACQTRLNTIWLGKMSMYTSTILFLLNLPFAFLTSKWFIFQSRRSEDYDNKDGVESIKGDSMESTLDDKKNIVDNNYRIKQNTKVRKEYLDMFRQEQQVTWKYISFCEAVSYYYRAPITKFTMHVISYLLFLTIYSYVCLVELSPLSNVTSVSQRQMEFAIYVYILSFILEGIRKAASDSHFDTIKGKILHWISSVWNQFDLVLYLIFLTAVILRNITSIDFVYARTIFSLTLSIFFIRFLQFYYAHRTIGPKVISVSRMIKDVIFFLALYVIAIFAYGTFAQALLYSNFPMNGLLLKSIVYKPFWQSNGDLDISYVEGGYSLSGVSATPNAIVIVAYVFFLLYTNVLLMNMLVAMFTNTFQKVEDNSNRIWAFNRYNLVEEFYFRPILPPPLNVFEIMFRFFKAMRCESKKARKLPTHDFVVNLTHDEDLRSAGFEQQCMEIHLIDNPLFKQYKESKPNVQMDSQILEREAPSASSGETSNSEQMQKYMSSLMDVMNDMKLEVKTVAAQLHKVRRHQKKDATLSRMNTIYRDPNNTKKILNVLPLDDES